MASPADSPHDSLAQRLTEILLALNLGEALDIGELAGRFKVSKRTLQRDLQRLAFLPLERGEDGRYRLTSPLHLGRLELRDLRRFAELAGAAALFPALDARFLRELLDARLNRGLSIQPMPVEPPELWREAFHRLRTAIGEHRRVRFDYTKRTGERKTVTVDPYWLMHRDGRWYLGAVDAGQPKAYALAQIAALCLLPEGFVPDVAIQAMFESEDSVWIKQKKIEVALLVAPPAAGYFQRQKLLAAQTLVKTFDDGSLMLTTHAADAEQVLPIVRQFLPHIRILKPEGWQAQLEAQLLAYVHGDDARGGATAGAC